MAKKKRRIFTEAQKNQAVEDYVSGKKSAAQVAADLAVAPDQVYKWKIAKDGRAREVAVDELDQAGSRPEDIQRIQDLERELREYKLMLAEKTVIEELLKKRLRSASSQQRSELTGLIETMELAAQKRKRAK